MASRLAWGCVFLTVFSAVAAIAQNNAANRKQIEAQAKQLATEGKALEKQGKLAEARDKYVDAARLMVNNDALNDIKHVDEQEKDQAEKLLDQAHKLFDEGKFSQSIDPLQHALDLQPSNAAIQYDLAICYLKLDDRANAALHLDMAIAMVADQKDRTELLWQRSQVLMGANVSAASGEGKKSLETFNQSYLQEDRDPGDTKAEGGSLCSQTVALTSALPANPAVVFNAAKCAAEDARPSDAAQRLADYAKLAPGALDLGEVQLQQQSLLALAALGGDAGQIVRQDYATANRYLDYRRYDRAVAEYESAEKAAPDFADAQWRVALLYEAFENVGKSREQLTRYQQIETDAGRKSEADAHLSTLDARRAVYEANVNQAQDAMTDLLLPSLGISAEGSKHRAKLTKKQAQRASRVYREETEATERFPEPYVQRELVRARADLDAAAELFPLGPEANELLALINLQGNDWAGAFRNYDAVASQGFPVSFYAQVYSAHDSKAIRATKVEIGADAIRLVYLSSYNVKKQMSAAPARPAGDDDLGNLVVSADEPPDADAETLTIAPADLKGIQTDRNFVVLKLPKDQIYLAPLNMLSDTPFEGGASRTFGNEYTRLFIRYLGYEDAKLGKEGMTAGEKIKLGFQIAQVGTSIGLSIATLGMAAPAAYSAAFQTAQIVHALAVLRTVSEAINIAGYARSGLQLADSLQTNLSTLQATTNDQRRAIAGIEFRVIPEQTAALKFRDKF